MNSSSSHHSLLWIAIVLVIAWVTFRVALAVTSVALHLLWVVALIMFAIWLFKQISGRRAP